MSSSDDLPGNRQHTRDDLAGDIRRVADDLETIPRRKQYREEGTHAVSTIITYFGDWDSALGAAGLPSAPHSPRRDIRDALYQAHSSTEATDV